MIRFPFSYTKLALVSALALLIGASLHISGSYRAFHDAQTIGVNVHDFDELSQRFSDLAKRRGAAYAYDVMKIAPLPPQTDLHLLGHVVGDELYTQEGPGGIRHCTQDFRNACSHSIVIGALAEFGEGALPLIRDACRDAPGGPGAYTMCFHGLGHGVNAGYQYELEPTVDFCRKTGTDAHNHQEYVECYGGAIMELMGGGGHDRDAWEAARTRYLQDPLSPCLDDVTPNNLKEICLIYITPRLWELVGINLGTPDPEKFVQAFELCEEIPLSQPHLRKACFGGFGKEFIPLVGARDIREVNNFSAQQFSRAIEWCEMSRSRDGVGYCINEALASVFWGGENDPQQSLLFCSAVEDSELQSSCYESLAGHIGFYIRDEKLRTHLCNAFPSAYRDFCSQNIL